MGKTVNFVAEFYKVIVYFYEVKVACNGRFEIMICACINVNVSWIILKLFIVLSIGTVGDV